jgi:hypothetical protein
VVEIGRFGELPDVGVKMSRGSQWLGCGGAVWPLRRNARGTAERNRASALGFWVAAMEVWCAWGWSWGAN